MTHVAALLWFWAASCSNADTSMPIMLYHIIIYICVYIYIYIYIYITHVTAISRWGACYSGDIPRIEEYLQNGQELPKQKRH